MSTNEKRARLVMDLAYLGSGAGVIEKSEAARRIAEAVFPDEEPLAKALGAWSDAPGTPADPGRALEDQEERRALRTKIAELTSAVEYRDRRIAEITHEKNELIAERDTARERAEGWKDLHAVARAKIEDAEAVLNGTATVRSVGEEASE